MHELIGKLKTERITLIVSLQLSLFFPSCLIRASVLFMTLLQSYYFIGSKIAVHHQGTGGVYGFIEGEWGGR